MGYNWRAAEAWRSHPLLTNTWRHSMPGLGIGLVAFGAYVAYDKLVASKDQAEGHH